MNNSKIFIQMAAYRDPQLVPTVLDCISKADKPENLVFCIAWQHSEDEKIDEIKNLPQVKIIDIPYFESKGACWARNQIQQRYDGEEYTLQLDSHHRFVEHWDTVVIGMYHQLQELGHKKPLLTSYIPSFDPDNDPNGRVQSPWKMDFDRFIPEGAIFFLPATIDDWAERTVPVPSRFYSAHFAFTTGQFCLEVPHDPEYYFHGEEISIAVRAFTHGYDLFHPHRVVAWHEYTRKGRTKHWDDHSTQNKEKTTDSLDWVQRNNACHKRNRCLFSMDGEKYESINWGPYGFGNERTLRDYEEYAGISFRLRGIRQEVLDKKYPSYTSGTIWQSERDRDASFHRVFKHCIDLSLNNFPLNDYDFWCVAFERADGTLLHRRDADRNEVNQLLSSARGFGSDGYIKLWREFVSPEKPHHWVVWAHSVSKDWVYRQVGNL